MSLAKLLIRLRSRTAAGLVCLALFTGFYLLAAVPELHNLVHSDSASETHHCPLTLLVHSQVNPTASDGVITMLDSVPFDSAPPIETTVLLSVYCQLPPGRGPPVA
jgi:hypothetical protein